MEIKKSFIYRATDAFDKWEEVAETLSRIGLGRKDIAGQVGQWRFYFNTITLQEFLTAKYLMGKITPDGFVYLLREPMFWNTCKLLINRKTKEDATFAWEVLTLLDNYDESKLPFPREMKFLLIGEFSTEILHKWCSKENIGELLDNFMNLSNDNYQYIGNLLLHSITLLHRKAHNKVKLHLIEYMP